MGIDGIILIAGGLGLFLFGMRIMSSGLQAIAGDRLHGFLQKATSNRFLGVFVGIVATVALNSSTASTVMTVSFVNSGLMNLTQSIGIILGANVGTTFSGQLVAFRVDAYAPIFIFVGVIMYAFIKDTRIKNIGYVILGFGILFFGITTMGGPLRGLGQLPEFREFLVNFSNPFLAILAGFAFTAAVQSSTAATGVLISMHVLGVPIPFETSAFIILGTNIGTSITTLIASIPANRESKRAAIFHIGYDIIGSAIFGTLIFLVPSILGWFEATWYGDTARQVAMFHTLYNVATMLMLLGFIGPIAKLLYKIVPSKATETDKTYEKKLIYLNLTNQAAQLPNIVVNAAHKEICRMGSIANKNLKLSIDSFFEKDIEKANKVLENEKVVNYLNQEITSKLVSVNSMRLSPNDAERVGKMFSILSDIERIGDHAENIAEYTKFIKENSLKFSDDAKEELKILSDTTIKLAKAALSAFGSQNPAKLPEIEELEETVDKLSKDFAQNHVQRLKTGCCDPKCGVIFVDMITDLERSGDHANNIAFSVQ
ncbi:MAG: Na/Pi cotransporter family protein [Defluviitaleaceae bacterium]|nr:Na/Pi cotransporter family protein [Defluviitaleaceae bacterium]